MSNQRSFEKIFEGTRKKSGYYWVVFTMVILIPLYPSFSNLGASSEFDFDRQYIDETSIVESYYDDGTGTDVPLFETKDSFISLNTIIDAQRDLSGTNEIIDYEVQSGDSISSIAYRFNVSNNTLYWANNFSKNHIIRPGDIIKVPPVSGVLYTIKSGDTLAGIAKKYSISEDNIKKQNIISDSSELIAGQDLVLPGAVKVYDRPKPTPAPSRQAVARSSSGYSFAAQAQSQFVNTAGKYNLSWRKPYSGVPGNCTWYVASYKNVDWRGNANQWMRNARAKGHQTGSTPKIGSIVQFEGRGYNPYYGHVGIVIDVTATHIIVSDMNYRRKYEVTTRKVPISDRSIRGYIYIEG